MRIDSKLHRGHHPLACELFLWHVNDYESHICVNHIKSIIANFVPKRKKNWKYLFDEQTLNRLFLMLSELTGNLNTNWLLWVWHSSCVKLSWIYLCPKTNKSSSDCHQWELGCEFVTCFFVLHINCQKSENFPGLKIQSIQHISLRICKRKQGWMNRNKGHKEFFFSFLKWSKKYITLNVNYEWW